MIFIDLNQALISGIMAQISKDSSDLEEGLVRHMVLNILRNHIKNFKNEYGEVVLCCDNKRYWRKDFFPFYKAGRKKSRDKSPHNWNLIFELLNRIRSELEDSFPHKIIDVDGAEADDIIGTLVPRFALSEKVLIISSDEDFLQLQRFENVKQFNPTLKKYIKCENPTEELKKKIIQGDRGDGIPNIFSSSDCFVREIRQKSITKSKMEEYLTTKYEDIQDESVKSGFYRNQMLIDLQFIPEEIKNSIINTFDATPKAQKAKFLNYLIEKKMVNMLDVIEDF